MAKSQAPGTHTSRGVNTTMGNASGGSASMESNSMKGPFDKKHDVGGDGIPVKMYDTGLGSVSVPKPGAGQGNSPILGGEGGQKRPGTK